MAVKGIVHKKELKDKDDRPVRPKRYDHLFLIVCEDQKSEPFYFNGFVKEFPDKTVFLRAVGTGRNYKGVVEQTVIERTKLYEEAGKHVDEVWSVFDKDDAQKSQGNTARFVDAFTLAKKQKIKVAYSNEVFELWLLLHFISVPANTPIARQDIYNMLTTEIRAYQGYDTFEYEHAGLEIFKPLQEMGSESDAINRAEKLYSEHIKMDNSPLEANPSTTVHILVKRLRELIEWYNHTPS
ncbi:MAG TPA: RloB family protein [Flavobacteriales bacterium]|nr:RloB family protein [Flavobacteriales bacterium]